jgi:hypothetical protein
MNVVPKREKVRKCGKIGKMGKKLGKYGDILGNLRWLGNFLREF